MVKRWLAAAGFIPRWPPARTPLIVAPLLLLVLVVLDRGAIASRNDGERP